MLKVGSFFAGLGGICLAFKNAGFDLLWSNELDKSACKTYSKNFDHILVEDDICNLKPEDKRLGKVDIITGGFPCQAFSIAGHRKGFEDERGRGKLFFEMLRFIDAYKPKVLFFENVRYLKTHDNGETYKTIKVALEKEGRNYHICDKVLDTCEYSKLPQHRERFYMVCFKSQKHAEEFNKLGWPEKVELKKRISFWQIIDETADEIHYFSRYPHYYRPAMKEIEKDGDREAFYQWRRVYCRKNKNSVCPTLTANMGGGGHNVPLVIDKRDLRRLTPQECLRLQGFDDKTFFFPDNISISAKYKQIGNAVSVPIVQSIAENIHKILNNKEI
ncbi:MAG: DNA (cytosine-5-)-methyltransferase [Campylobacteraceae bacterium]|jgi:DNA (cytosine-5)-methyltransferase 1|nr:DNA (cytosine-5-)-methyltransferase [Campylobacteraceae bacterium]